MKIGDKIKSLFRRRPPTDEELDARAEAETAREQAREDEADVTNDSYARRRYW